MVALQVWLEFLLLVVLALLPLGLLEELLALLDFEFQHW